MIITVVSYFTSSYDEGDSDNCSNFIDSIGDDNEELIIVVDTFVLSVLLVVS